MPSPRRLPSDTIYVALEALQCSPDEIALALGVDLPTLWGYYGSGSEQRMPEFVLQRLATLLHDRAALLRDLAGLLGGAPVARRALLVS